MIILFVVYLCIEIYKIEIMKNLKITFMLTILLLFVMGVQAQTVTPSKNYITREVNNVTDFSSIKVLGSPDVEYRQSNDSKTTVLIYGSDNLVDLLDVTTENGILRVKMKEGVRILSGERRLKVIASSPSLVRVEVQGSSDVDLKGIIQGSDLQLNVQGSGDIDAEDLQIANITGSVKGSGDINLKNVKATHVKMLVSGSGDIEVKGVTQQAMLAVSGSGDITTDKLMANHVTATVSGSGDIECYASQQLDATVAGRGDIEYKGNPSIVNKQGKKNQITRK